MSEKLRARPEEPTKVPKEIAEKFANRTLKNAGEFVDINPLFAVRRVFGRVEKLPNGEKGLLYIDHALSHVRQGQGKEEQMRFEYHTMPDSEHPKEQLAEVWITNGKGRTPGPDYDYNVIHRYVYPEHRRVGYGQALYKEAEAFMQQVANAKGKDIVLRIGTDQPAVLTWAENLGYEPYDDSRTLWQEWKHYPNRFGVWAVRSVGGQLRDPYLYRLSDFVPDRDGKPKRLAIALKKILHPGE